MNVLICDTDLAYAQNLATKLKSLRNHLDISVFGTDSQKENPDLILLGSEVDPFSEQPEIPRLFLCSYGEPNATGAILQEQNPYYGEQLQRYSLPEQLVEAIDRWSLNHPSAWKRSHKHRLLYLPSALTSWNLLSPFLDPQEPTLVVPIAPSYLFPFLPQEQEQAGLSEWLEHQIAHLQSDCVNYIQIQGLLHYFSPLQFGSDLELLLRDHLNVWLQRISDLYSLRGYRTQPLYICGGMPPSAFSSLMKDASEIRFFCPPGVSLNQLKQELLLSCQTGHSSVQPLPYFGVPEHEPH